MPKLVLDTNVLIADFRGLRPYAGRRPADAERRAKELIENEGTDAIVSPVEVEFLCGVVDPYEMELAEAYLKAFRLIDRRATSARDWKEARRIAKHVGPSGGPRDLGDCLISAIADRLKHDVKTYDKGLRQQRGRTRQRRP